MAFRTYMRLIAILAFVGLMSGQVSARRGRAAGGTRGAARAGSLRAARGSPSAGSSRAGSLRSGRRSARIETSTRRSFRSGRNSQGRRGFRRGGSRYGRSSPDPETSTRGSFRTGRHSAGPEDSAATSFRLFPFSRTYHIGRHFGGSVRHRTTYYTSGIGRYRYNRYYRRYRRFGPYFYIGLPYYRYYGCGYPYYYTGGPYYYYSLPYYRYYYPYREYYHYEYHNYDYPPPTYRPRKPCTPQDPCTCEQEKTPAQQTHETPEQTEGAAEYVQPDPRLKNIADAFAAGDYEKAALQANQALTAEPNNAVLPFIYSQALFADGKYGHAADVLREAVRKLDPENQELFYPLGFYHDEDLLNNQIAALSETAAAEPSNADLQLVLGYQLLGVASYDAALDALQKAHADYVNKEAAAVMIDILEKARAAAPPDQVENPQS